MKKKNKYLCISLVLLVTIGLFIMGNFKGKDMNNKSKTDINIDTSLKLPKTKIDYIQSLVGLKSTNMKILDNPLRIEGRFYIPEDTILTYIKYYLKKTNNKDIQNIKITINENALTISGSYKLLDNLKTPIDIDILPTLTDNNDLRLSFKDIRLLNLSLSNNIIDAIAESWFSNLDNIVVDEGDIIIDKSFFKNTNIKFLFIEEDYLVIDLSIIIK